MTDENPVYWAIGPEFSGHRTVNHSAEDYLRAAFWHTNTVENYFSLFKRAVFGCYFHVSEAHLIGMRLSGISSTTTANGSDMTTMRAPTANSLVPRVSG